jgi:hypothetical protein
MSPFQTQAQTTKLEEAGEQESQTVVEAGEGVRKEEEDGDEKEDGKEEEHNYEASDSSLSSVNSFL